MVKKVALPINNKFIVTALDFAVKLLIADIEYSTIKQKHIVKINELFPSLRANRLSKLHLSHHTNHCAKNTHFVLWDNGFVIGVGRLQNHLAGLGAVEVFYSVIAVNNSYHNVTDLRLCFFIDNHLVAFVDAGIDHAVPADANHNG